MPTSPSSWPDVYGNPLVKLPVTRNEAENLILLARRVPGAQTDFEWRGPALLLDPDSATGKWIISKLRIMRGEEWDWSKAQ